MAEVMVNADLPSHNENVGANKHRMFEPSFASLKNRNQNVNKEGTCYKSDPIGILQEYLIQIIGNPTAQYVPGDIQHDGKANMDSGAVHG